MAQGPNKRGERPDGGSFGFTVQEVSGSELKRARRRADGAIVTAANWVDPGNKRLELIAAGVILVLLPVVIFFQQFTRTLGGETLATAPESVKESEVIREPGVSQLALYSKMAVKLAYLDKPDHRKVDQESMQQLDSIAWSRTDRLRVAIVAADLLGPDEGLRRLAPLAAEAEPGGELSRDIGWITIACQKGADAVDPAARESIIARHGWFGQVAMTLKQHASQPIRWDAISGGMQIIKYYLFLGVLVLLILVAGLAVGIVAFFRSRRESFQWRFEPSNPGSSVYLETFAIFLAGFMLMQAMFLITFGAGIEGTTGALAFHEVLTWALVVGLFWPRIRGVSWSDFFAGMGLNRGQGVLKEIGCGALGYLAGVPVMVVGIIAAICLRNLVESDGGAQQSNGYGMFNPSEGNSWVLLFLQLASTVVWAPIVEESIFRGALYRHLRGRLRTVFSVILTACMFGIIHPYTTAGLVQVGFMGLVLALLREWRGSLIAPMVAHAIHNGLISTFTIGLALVVD
jgi:membrane protease YdiL (CAAX protease family)